MRRCAPALLAVAILLIAPSAARAQGAGEAREYIRRVYLELVDAEQRGAAVTGAALKLNEALRLVQEAEREADASRRAELLSQALSLAEEVDASIPKLVEEGESRAWWWKVTLASTAAFVAVGSALTYFYAPRLVWDLWLKLRRDWKVRRA